MPYNQYSIKDFVVDDYFIKWIKSPDPQTDAYWRNWLKANPHREALVEEARGIVLALSQPGKQLSEKDKKHMWEKINQRRNVSKDKVEQQETLPHRPFIVEWLYIGKLAASLTAILLIAAFWIWTSGNRPMIKHLTQYGEVKNIKLPDGSSIILNANSSLSFSSHWHQQAEREVYLTGEAFFQVTKKKAKGSTKFVVHTEGIDVEVLGTEFNINNRRDKVQVVLQEGKVKLSQRGKENMPIFMIPGDLIEYSQKDKRVERKKVNPFMYSSWKEQEMLFEDKPLFEIAQEMEDTKGLQIIFSEDSLKNLRFTGTLPNNDLDSYLLILSKSFGITISQKGNQIMLHKK